MKNDLPYDWDWAEKDEASFFQNEKLAKLHDSQPYFFTFLNIFYNKLTSSETKIPPPNLLSPLLQKEIPPHINALACALCNPNDKNSLDWVSHIIQNQDYTTTKTILDALSQVQDCCGSIHCVSPPCLNSLLLVLPANTTGDEFSDRMSNMLVQIFQTNDLNPPHAEDRPFAPLCQLLIYKGKSNVSYRNKNGASALSGINKMLTEASFGMANHNRITDLLLCAEMILNAGSPIDLIREMPPLNSIISNDTLLNLITSKKEQKVLYDNIAPPNKPHSDQEPYTPKRL